MVTPRASISFELRRSGDAPPSHKNSQLIIYPDSGHGAVFQFHADSVPKAIEFLAR